MSTAVIKLATPPPGMFPEELRKEETDLAHVRLMFEKHNQPDKNDPNAIVEWIQEAIAWSFRVVEIRTVILLKREETKLAVVESMMGSDMALSIMKDYINAKISRYVAAFDHVERMEAHLGRAIEAYRSILSALKEERNRSTYTPGH